MDDGLSLLRHLVRPGSGAGPWSRFLAPGAATPDITLVVLGSQVRCMCLRRGSARPTNTHTHTMMDGGVRGHTQSTPLVCLCCVVQCARAPRVCPPPAHPPPHTCSRTHTQLKPSDLGSRALRKPLQGLQGLLTSADSSVAMPYVLHEVRGGFRTAGQWCARRGAAHAPPNTWPTHHAARCRRCRQPCSATGWRS
jgi:hypothetical protein